MQWRTATISLFLAAALSLPWAGGCTRTISEKETVTQKNGRTTVNRETVKEHPDGTVSVEKEHESHR
jgi:hypothetical protein